MYLSVPACSNYVSRALSQAAFPKQFHVNVVFGECPSAAASPQTSKFKRNLKFHSNFVIYYKVEWNLIKTWIKPKTTCPSVGEWADQPHRHRSSSSCPMPASRPCLYIRSLFLAWSGDTLRAAWPRLPSSDGATIIAGVNALPYAAKPNMSQLARSRMPCSGWLVEPRGHNLSMAVRRPRGSELFGALFEFEACGWVLLLSYLDTKMIGQRCPIFRWDLDKSIWWVEFVLGDPTTRAKLVRQCNR
jgi:hypothetical protein